MQRILTPVYFFLTFYLIGVLAIENEVNYRTWSLLEPDGFAQYHRELERLLQPFLMIPLTVTFLLSWAMTLFRGERLVRLLHVVSAALLTVFTVVSLALMVPLHRQLSEAYDADAISQLIENNLRFRSPLVVAIGAINIVLLHRLLDRSRSPEAVVA